MSEKAKINDESRINTPANIVTIARVCLIPVFVVALLCPWPEWLGVSEVVNNHAKAIVATIIFIVISLTDWIDGYLARSRGEVTTFGKFMDPLADKMLVIAALLALIELKILPSWPVMIIIAREFVVAGVRMLAANKGVVIAASWYGKLKTLAQIVAIVLFLLKEGVSVTTSSSALSNPLYIVAWVVMVIALVLTIVSMVDYLKALRDINSAGNSSLKTKIEYEASSLLDDLRAKGLKVITAESLTGGMICESLTAISGSSDVVVGGIASYAFELKRDALSVDFDRLQRQGAVNEETVEEMAKGALTLSIADVAVAVSGIAGPSGEEVGKPVGTVFMALAKRNEDNILVKRYQFEGDRTSVREETTLRAISELRQFIA